MKKSLVFLLLLSASVLAHAQTDFSFVAENFKSLILTEVNRVRDSMNVGQLTADPTLDKAALMQAEWCKQHGELSHYQKENGNRYEPVNRVMAVGGHHDGVAENLLFSFPKAGQSPAAFARELVWIWVHSPGHFANMVHPAAHLSGLGLTLDLKKGRLYACLVFAVAEWQPPFALKIHRRAWGIKPKNDAACAGLDKFAGKEREFSYGFRYGRGMGSGKGQVTFFHGNANLVKDMIRYPKGAIAPDIVFRNQFPCGAPNLLHGSPYHDGYLLKPRTWKWLNKHNAPDSLHPHSLKALTHKPIGSLNPDSLQINSVITKQRHFCRYGYPVSIMTGYLGPFSFELPPDTIRFQKVTPWKHRHLEFRVPFAKGNAVPNRRDVQPLLDSLKLPGGEVVSLRIRGYASIEGPLSINQGLMDDRAQSILDLAQAQQRSSIMMKATAAENWHDFRRDIKGTEFEWMMPLSDDQVRDTLKQNKTLLADLEFILGNHRYSAVEVDLRYALPDSLSSTELADSFGIALALKKFTLAHRLQSEMIRRWMRKELDASAILKTPIPFSKFTLALRYNQDWMAAQLSNSEMPPVTEFMVQKSRGYPWFLMRKTLAETKTMAIGGRSSIPAKVVFQNIQVLKGMGVSSEMVRKLELNYYIGAALAGLGKGSPDLRLLEDVRARYSGDTLTARMAVTLGKFYNVLGGTAATLRMLKPYTQPFAEDEEFVFLFAWTAAIHLDLVPEEEWLTWMAKANRLNPTRWRAMVSKDWQLLRWEQVKGMYCACA